MAPASFRASAPGSLMLLGEHAVLHGRLALVCAVNRRIHVTLTPRSDRKVVLRSNLGRAEMTLDRLRPAKPFRFVAAAITLKKNLLPSGFNLQIRSGFSHRVGLGSSAAVTVATLAVLSKWIAGRVRRARLLADGVRVIRKVQGLGSGADVAASVFGGIVAYRTRPLTIRRLRESYPLTVVYSGSKKPTVEVVRLVERARRRQPRLFGAIYDLMDLSADVACWAIRRRNWRAFGELLDINQGLMEAVGVSNAKLAAIVGALQADPGILGAKISGSGLGDCVVGLGRPRSERFSLLRGRPRRARPPFKALPVRMASAGVT